MVRPTPRHLLPGAAAFAAALLVAPAWPQCGRRRAGARRPRDDGPVELQLLGVNDFHGHLEPPEPGLGGAAWLGAHLNQAARSHPDRTIRVHAGDMIGASPFISSHFHDEPTIEATNMMGFDVGAVGNHEFDEGGDELLRVLQGSRYPWLAANTVDPETRRHAPAALSGHRASRRACRLHRRDDRRHADLAAARVQARLSLPRHLGHGQPLGARAARKRRRGDRRARSLRARSRRATRRRARSRTRPRRWTTPSTSSSRGTPTRS